MEGTSTTTTHTGTRSPAVTAAIVAHGLMALGMHMAEHNLPLYLDVETPTACIGRPIDRIVVQLSDQSVDAWADSIEVDSVTFTTLDDVALVEERHILGRLPNSGVRVDLMYFTLRMIGATA